MDRLGIEFITALGQDPVDFVHLAADLGAPHIGIALAPIVMVPEDGPRWSLRNDAALFNRTKAAISARDVTVMLGEGFLIHPQMEMANSAADMDLLANLGAQRLNVVSIDGDLSRSHDQFALFAEMAGERGMAATIEFLPGMPSGDLASATAHVIASGSTNAGVLLDSMHFFRSGGTIAQLKATDPALIGHAQLCDLPEVSPFTEYADQAKYERLAPGHGVLPLAEFYAALPDSIMIGLEIPQRSSALAGVDHHQRIGAILSTARSFTTDLSK